MPPGFHDEVVLEAHSPGTEAPTTFKFAPDGRTFVALKGGKILVYPQGAIRTTAPTVFANLSRQTYDNGDHGLLGLALDPRFDEGRPYVYALYTYNHELGAPQSEMPKWKGAADEGDPCPQENHCVVSGRLVRLTAEGDHAKEAGGEVEEDVLLEDWCQQSNTHSIGDLAFGPEGALFVSGGEGGLFTNTDYGQVGNLCGDPNGTKGTNMQLNPEAEGGALRAQSLLRPDGKVLLSGTLDRIDPETGEGWPGNPDASSPNANARRIVAMGLRNPFRFAISPRLGEVFVNNVGAAETEEIDRVPIGGPIYNSGWPCYEGLGPNPQFKALNLNACNRLYETPGSTSLPFFHYSHTAPVVPGDSTVTCPLGEGSAISGSAFYDGSTYPNEYDGALFFADSVRGCVYVMLAEEDGAPDPSSVRPFLTAAKNFPGVDLEQGPEGDIYYDDLYEGTINRISYDPGAPTAKLKVDGNAWGPVGTTFELDAGESTAATGHTLKYEWDLEGGNGSFSAGSDAPRQQFTFGESKNVEIAVRVTDESTGKSAIARVTIYPGDSPPQVTIAKPLPSLTWSVGQQIEFAGSAKARGGSGPSLPASDLYWKTRLLHCPFEASSCHEHPLQVFPGVASGTLGAPDHDFPAYVHFFLTATDERGLAAEADVKVEARPVSLQFRSEPPGVEIIAGTKTLTTPGELAAIEDSPTTVIAPEAIAYAGLRCTFERWSDGGARVHQVPTTGPGTYTAYYAGPDGAGTCRGREGGGEGAGAGTFAGPPKPGTITRPKLAGHPAKRTRSTVAKFTFKGPARAVFRCKLDRRTFSTCRSPKVYRRLKPGRHTVRIYAQTTGARSAATTFSWRILGARRR